MKYVDEFRDPRLIRLAARRNPHAGRSAAALPDHGSLRRPYARHLPLRPEGFAAAERRVDPRPGLSRLRVADGPDRRRAGFGQRSERDLHGLRRHDARARLERQPAGKQSPRGRRADRLFAARRAENRPAESRSQGRVLRDRLRDDRPVDRADAAAGPGAGREEFRRVLQPRHDHSGDPRDSRFARHAAGCVSSARGTFRR